MPRRHFVSGWWTKSRVDTMTAEAAGALAGIRVLELADESGVYCGKLLADLGPTAANDGLALDELGRVYVAANGAGQIWRVDPRTRETVLIAEGLPGVASLAFGRGEFDHHALYATSTRTGRVWEVRVGVGGEYR